MPHPNMSEDNLDEYTEEIRDTIKDLKTKTKDATKYRTKKIFTRKYWVMDFVKITSVPLFYLIFPTKKYFQCKRKEVRKALRYNCIIAGNHLGPCDPFLMYMHFFQRRIKVIATEQLFNIRWFNFALNRSGVIKYHRDTMNHIDVDAFKEATGTLNGNGVVGIFPEGHINFDGILDDSIKQGAATMSLLTNSPIIPFIFVNQYKYFRFNKVMIGKPIYPSDYFTNIKIINSEMIEKYNNIIYDSFKGLYDASLEKRKKNGYKRDIKRPS